MKSQSTITFTLAIFILSLCYFGYLEFVASLGVPDGFISDYAMKASLLYKVTLCPLLGLSIYTFYLGVKPRNSNGWKNIILPVLALVIIIAIFMLLNMVLYNNFDHGQGG